MAVSPSETSVRVAHHVPSKATRILFALCSFVSAFLLFQVQLIVSKCILPWFGGSAAVWTTAMLVFQLLLLAGYLYAHVLVLRLVPSAQSRTHLGLLAVGTLWVAALSYAFPSAVTPGPTWRSVAGGHPTLGVACIILVAAGLPFFILSTTGPLLQSWFARLGGGEASYRLYAISNVGSLLGLLSYPLAIEPSLHLAHQGQLWTLLFFAFMLSCMKCARLASTAEKITEQAREATDGSSPAGWRAYGLWFILPACGSVLFLSTTNMLCQGVTTIPLLWVVPLSIYLLSFILCFDHPRWYRRSIIHPLFAISLFAICFALPAGSAIAELAGLPVLLFLSCMICHGELTLLKPESKRLTEFYLAISVGGAAGGVFVAVLAPVIFSSFAEFQLSLGMTIVLMLTCLAVDRRSWIYRQGILHVLGITLGTIATAYVSAKYFKGASIFLGNIRFYAVILLLGTLSAAGAFVFERTGGGEGRTFRFVHVPIAFAAIIACLALYSSAQHKAELILSRRDFYGVVRVFRQPLWKELTHGRIVHGSQLYPPMDSYPTTYYGAQSGIGILLQNHPKRSMGNGNLRIGAVGLGVGTIAAYGRPGDSIRFYEIDPDVVNLSAGANPVFTYLRDSQAQVSVVQGDGRLMLEKEHPAASSKFDILVLDAFSGDAIPVHLLTKEAFAMYWERVDPEYGVIAVHITSRHINLLPVLQGVSREFGTDLLYAVNLAHDSVFGSSWVLLSRRKILRDIPELADVEVGPTDRTPPLLWTDDYSNVFRLIR